MYAIARIGLVTAALMAAGVAPAWAQEVLPDRIVLHGSEFIPRFTDLPRVLVVPAGHTVTLPPDSTWDAIEVAGTLRVSRTRDTTCRFIHLTILPGGTLDAGTIDDPVLTRVELIVRDVAIDTAKDPFQWGNGIINLGHQSRIGRRLERTWTELTEDAEAGALTIRLEVPAGWQVGDELLLPDMRQIDWKRAPLRREPTITIAAIQGDTIQLSRALTFEHLSVKDPDGAVVARPRVANRSRNIVVRSENPTGVRGHTVNTGAATWDIRHNRLIGLGRTTAEKLDSTEADPETGRILRIGLNQIARYASHDHHVHAHGAHQHHAAHRFIGNTLEANGPGKWGHVVHGSHDTLVEENIAIGFIGAGFVTEDGYEVRNIFRRNVAVHTSGNGIDAPGNVDPRRGNDSPGGEGAGFWFRGLHQTVEGNEAWNNVIGFNLFPRRVVLGQRVPERPGARAEKLFDPRKATPVAFTGNVALSNSITGVEYWDTSRFEVANQVTAHNGQRQVFMGQSGANLWLTDVTIIASGGTTTAISSSEAYTSSLEIDGGRIAGCAHGIIRGGARHFVRLRNVRLQNRTNVVLEGRPDESLFENVVHVPLGAFPKRYIVLGRGDVWEPGGKPPRRIRAAWTPQRGTRHLVVNWQGTGVDYRLYENQQRRSAPAWPAVGSDSSHTYCPVAGLTMGECWDRFGLAYGGGVVADEDAVELEGLVHGVGRVGREETLGTPRAVLTSPNMLAPVTPTHRGQIRLRLVLTGNSAHANDVAIVQINDGRPERVRRGRGQALDEIVFVSDAIEAGVHSVRTWREAADGVRIPESQLTFRYVVEREGAATRVGMTR